MKIGCVAERSGLSAKTIRYYEDIGLLTPKRSDNGYRDYCDADLSKLVMLRRARQLGISLQHCRQLLTFYETPAQASCDIRSNAIAWIADIDRQIEELRALRTILGKLVRVSSARDKRSERPVPGTSRTLNEASALGDLDPTDGRTKSQQ